MTLLDWIVITMCLSLPIGFLFGISFGRHRAELRFLADEVRDSNKPPPLYPPIDIGPNIMANGMRDHLQTSPPSH